MYGQPDLKSISSNLASDIETAMANVYNLQTSLINAHTGNPAPGPHQLISKIRPRLKELWEVIRAFLQKTHAFGGDVIMLQDSLNKESAEDCMEFLIEMTTTSNQLLEWSKTLTTDAMNLAKEFSSWAPTLKSTLREQKARVYHAKFGEYESERSTIEAHLANSENPETLPRTFQRRFMAHN